MENKIDEIWKNIIDLFLDGEIWKDIEGYNGDYQISNFGRVKSLKFYKEKILKQLKDNNGYLFVKLYINNKGKIKKIHHLVYENFYEKLRENECVHHISENKLNNIYNNLKKMDKFNHNSFHQSGKKHSEKTRKLISKKMSGENHPMFGKHIQDKTKELLSKIKRKDFSEIKNEFEYRGYQLLTKKEEYKNCYTKLKYIHLKCGNKHSICWNDFKQNKGCPYCGKNKIKFSDIENRFKNKGFILLTKENEYKNKQKLEYMCKKCGKKSLISLSNLRVKNNCC